jgi:hypothetical protein
MALLLHFERALAAVADGEPHLDDLFLAWREHLENRLGLLLEIHVDHRFGRRGVLVLLATAPVRNASSGVRDEEIDRGSVAQPNIQICFDR